MPSYTPNLNLYKYNTATDGNELFNVNLSMNDNWDKIDTNVQKITDNTLTTTDKTIVGAINEVNAKDLGANKDLSNLSENGEAHFASPSLNNLDSNGEARFIAKADADLPQITAPYLKTTYVDPNVPTSGYNIWSNGYCEQWGQITTAGYGRTSTINLAKKFASTNYQVLLSWTYETMTGDHGSTAAYRDSAKAVSSFVIYSCFENYQPIVTWRVLGYLESGQY